MAMIFSEKNVEVHSLHILLTVFICPFSKGKHPGVKKIAFLITDGLLNVFPRRPLEIFVVAVGDYKTGNSGIVEIASLDRKYHVFRFTDTSCFFDVTKLAF